MSDTRLPDFLVIGAQKAGTTWLTRNLRSHPEICMPLEEIRFFTRNYSEGPAWYASKFAAAGRAQIIGEGTPGYLWQPAAANRILATLGPDVRLIGIVRDPVARAYSAFWNLLSGGQLPLNASFPTEFENDTNGLRTRGLYAEQIERFVERFGTEGLLTFVTELDLGPNGPRTIERAFDFLGVDNTFVPPSAQKRANVGEHRRAGGAGLARVGVAIAQRSDLLPPGVEGIMRRTYRAARGLLPVRRAFEPLDLDTRARCLDSYESDISRLERLLGRDLSHWRDRLPHG